jgi:hypothetical protein
VIVKSTGFKFSRLTADTCNGAGEILTKNSILVKKKAWVFEPTVPYGTDQMESVNEETVPLYGEQKV